MNKKSIWPILLSASIMTAAGFSNMSYAAEDNLPATSQVVEESKQGQQPVDKEEKTNPKDQAKALEKAEVSSPKESENADETNEAKRSETEEKKNREADNQAKAQESSHEETEAREEAPKDLTNKQVTDNPQTEKEEETALKQAKTQNSMGGGRERAADSDLEISEEVVPEAQKESQPIEIDSWEKLKTELEYKDPEPSVDNWRIEQDVYKRLQFRNNSYKLTGDIYIDMSDSFFDGKDEYINEGLFSNTIASKGTTSINDNVPETSFNFDGNHRKITIKPKENKPAPALFGRIKADKLTLKNIDLEIKGDVLGFPFADEIEANYSRVTDIATELTKNQGEISDINIKVEGSVVGIESILKHRNINNHATGKFNGKMATGFAAWVIGMKIKDLNIDIGKDIVADASNDIDPEVKTKLLNDDLNNNYAAGAFGFAWNPTEGNAYPSKSKARKEVIDNDNYEILKNNGLYQNININVGGSIKAIAYDNAYASGFTRSTGSLWLDNIHIDIKGNIETHTKYDSSRGFSAYDTTVTTGFGEDVSVLENSSLKVKGLVTNVESEYSTNVYSDGKLEYYTLIHGIGEVDPIGCYTSIKNNKIEIGSISAKSKSSINATAAYRNRWESDKDQGQDWFQLYEDNEIKVGDIKLEATSDKPISYIGLADKVRTGKDEEGKELKEVAAKNNKLTVGSLDIKTATGKTSAYLGFRNAANAKDNHIVYGDVNIKSGGETNFFGLGELINYKPRQSNGIKEVTEGNTLKVGKVNITAADFPFIGLMFGTVDNDKTGKNNRAQYDEVAIEAINSTRTPMIGGISAWNEGKLEDNHIYIENFKVDIKNSEKSAYISPGIAYNKGDVKKSTVFVNKLIDVTTKIANNKATYLGGFLGLSNQAENGANSIENCHVQVGGGFNNPKGGYGAFGSWVKNYLIKDSSALVFNGFTPFVNKLVGGGLDHIAHYSSSPVWKNYGAFIGTSSNSPYIKNSTFLSDFIDNEDEEQIKKLKDPVLYRSDLVDLAKSTKNYVVLVGEKDASRVAYEVKEVDANTEEMRETTIKVWKKDPNALVGKLSIAKRDFQDKYWGYGAKIYETGKDEKDFAYVFKNPDGLSFKHFGFGADKIAASFLTANLADYFKRFGGIYVQDGPIYDLLGIKGYPDAPKPDPSPAPEPNPDPSPEPSPIPKPIPLINIDEDYIPDPITPEEIEKPEPKPEPSHKVEEDGPQEKEKIKEETKEETKIKDASGYKKTPKQKAPKTGITSSVGILNLLMASIAGLKLSKKKKDK